MSCEALYNDYPFYIDVIKNVYCWALAKGVSEKDIVSFLDQELEDITTAVGGISNMACERYLCRRLYDLNFVKTNINGGC